MSEVEERDPLDLPTEQLRKDAFELFGEAKEVRAQKIEEVRLALDEIECGDFDKSDANLVRYLRGKKFNVEKAVKCIHNRIKFTKEHPAWTTNLAAKEFEAFFSFMTILPQRDKENRVILLARPGLFIRMCTKEFIRDYPYAMIRFNLWMNEALSSHPEINVYGAVFILSAVDLSIWDAATFSAVAKVDERAAFFKYLFSCTPMRVGGIFMFDEPFFVRLVLNLVSVFLSSKIKSRLHVNGKNYSVLSSVVDDVSALPTTLGGNVDVESMNGPANEYLQNLFFPNGNYPADTNTSQPAATAAETEEGGDNSPVDDSEVYSENIDYEPY